MSGRSRRGNRPLVVGLVCLALTAGACANTTSREERLAARGIAAADVSAEGGADEQAAPAAATTPAPSETEAAAAAPASVSAPASGSGSAPVAAPANAGSAAPGVARPASGRSAANAATGPAQPAPSSATPGAAPAPANTATGGAGRADAQPAASAPAAATPAVADKSEIVFGSFGVEAGPLGTISGVAPPAIRAWAADVNSRGGLNGHPVRLVMADDGGDPARAQAIVRQMVEKDGVIAFLYPYAIGTLVPVLPYLESKGIPVLGHMGAETKADYSDAMFMPLTSADKGMTWAFIFAVITQTEKRKLGLLYCREVAACTLQKDSLKELLPYEGLEGVYEAQISLAQPDYTAETLGAQRAGVDVLLTFGDVATVARVAQSAHRQGYQPVISGVQSMQHTDTLAYQDDLDEMVTFSRIPPMDSPKLADYRRAMSTFQPKAPRGELGASAYVVGRLVEQRLAVHLDDDPTSAELTEALYGLKTETLDGLLPGVTFPRDKDRSKVNLCSVPIKFVGGKFVAHDAAASFVCAPGWKPQ